MFHFPTMRGGTSIRRVLVVFKDSKLDRYVDRGKLHDIDPLDEGARQVLARLRSAHAEHGESVARCEQILEASGLEIMRAAQPRKRDTARADLVISIGGDGTFLWCARAVDNVPMLGVNSAPGTSTGHYCGATAENLPEHLEAILSGSVEPQALPRLRVEISGRLLPYRALNDVLFTHKSPVCSARYLLELGDTHELQISSGIWISTASGSTGAMMSAGGVRMATDDWRMQYRVREPYLRPGQSLELTGGIIDGPLRVVSRSPSNGVFIDGLQFAWAAGFGSSTRIEVADKPLMVYEYRGPTR